MSKLQFWSHPYVHYLDDACNRATSDGLHQPNIHHGHGHGPPHNTGETGRSYGPWWYSGECSRTQCGYTVYQQLYSASELTNAGKSESGYWCHQQRANQHVQAYHPQGCASACWSTVQDNARHHDDRSPSRRRLGRSRKCSCGSVDALRFASPAVCWNWRFGSKWGVVKVSISRPEGGGL